MPAHLTSAGPIFDTSITELVLAQAHDRGTKAALVDAISGRTLSYAALVAGSARSPKSSPRMGCKPGDVVALCAPNSI
jgi:acyl-CoA synthetase (AMP-forming)/AMP-acid ligase II